VTATLAVSLALAVTPTPSASAVTVSTFAHLSGRQIMTAAMAAARTRGSCTSSTATTISGQQYASVTDSTLTSGQQTLRLGAAQSVVRVVGHVVYVYDDAAAIQAQFGVSAPQYANRWIAVPSTNSNFARFNSGIVLNSMLSEVAPGGALRTTTIRMVLGQRVVGVSGKANIHLGLASGTETVYVAAVGSHVPVELVASDVVQGQRQSFAIVFSHWGKDFHLTRPATSTPISATTLPS
jgi:hypothetical protein